MGDQTDLIASILSDAGDGTSVDKVRGVLAAATAVEPTDEETAQLLALFTMVSSTGVIERAIPQDPDQLDALLGRGAQLFMQLRSDHAPYLGIVAWHGDVATSDEAHPSVAAAVEVPVHVEPES